MYVTGPWISCVAEEMHITDAAAAVGIATITTADITAATLITDDTT
jgi:hypothetical protein